MSVKSIFFIILLCQNFLFAQTKHLLLCIVENNSSIASICQENNTTSILRLKSDLSYDAAIFEIQTDIRTLIDKNNSITLTLFSKGMLGTLTAIAQGNMLPYYREHIKGLILEDAYAKLLEICPLKKHTTDNLIVCKKIKQLHTKHKEASLYEVTKALSPRLQMDWFYPKVLLVSSQKDSQYEGWINALNENSIPYESSKILNCKILQEFMDTLSELPKKPKSKKPNYYGPILRFHLAKIYYKPKKDLTIWHDLYYGKSKQQTYDVYFKANSKQNNKLLIYVHGGGWNDGNKSDYAGVAKQFSDKGFTVVTVDYRYLKLPNITMQTMIEDIKNALDKIISNHTKYHFNKKKIVVMGESTGAYLLYMALVNNDMVPVKVSILNSMPSDLSLYTKEKQIRLCGIKNKQERAQWLKRYSPLKNLDAYKTKTLSLQGLDDKIIKPKHLEVLDLYSVIHYKNIEAHWVLNAGHPLSPLVKSMSPSYQELEELIDRYIDKYLYKK